MADAGHRAQSAPKLPPYSIESEQSVLGGMMLDNRTIDAVAERLKAGDFYRQDHQLIFDVILRMHARRRPVDFVTLTEAMRNLGQLEDAGGLAYLGTLANDCPSAVNVVAYADIVRERAAMRTLIAVGGDIADMGYRPDGRSHEELLDLVESRVLALRQRGDRGELAALSQPQLMDLVEKRIEQIRENPGSFAGLATGFTDLDRLTTGLQPGDLVIVAGRPSMGKTSFAMNIAEHVAMYEKKAVDVFTMEMPAVQLQMRTLSSFARIDLSRLRNGELEDRDYDRLFAQGALLREAPLYIDETGALSLMQLRAKAKRAKALHGTALIVVDYIQLMTVPGAESREKEIGEISRGLKALAKELQIPVVALSQINRGVENRTNQRPRMADLRESGAIEQDADLVAFIYRDEVYNKETQDKGVAEIIIAKQRNGALGTVRTAFLGQYTRFENLAQGSLGY